MAYDFPNSPTVGQAYSGYVWDGEKWVAQSAVPAGAGWASEYGFKNATLAVSAAAGALTIALKDNAGNDPSSSSPCLFNFRNTNGMWTQISATAAMSLVVPSGATLAVTSAKAFRLWVVMFNDAGTLRLGVINCSTYAAGTTNIYPLAEYAGASATSVSGSSNSAGVFYANAAVTAKAYLILGFVEWGATGLTAGTWTTTNLILVQSFGPGVYKPGEVVQQFTTQLNTSITTTATSFTSTGITATLTPQSAANPIRVSMFAGIDHSAQGNTSGFDVNRGATSMNGVLGTTYLASAVKQGTGAGVIPTPFQIHDFPNATSSIVYTLMWQTSAATGTLGARNGGTFVQPTMFAVHEIMG